MSNTTLITLRLPGVKPWEAIALDSADVRQTDVPWSGRTVTGYGGRIPTCYMIRHAGRWHRVRVMVYGNAGSAYITVRGAIAYVETY